MALSKPDIPLRGKGAGVALGVGAVALSADSIGAGVTLGIGVVAFGADLVARVARDDFGVIGADP